MGRIAADVPAGRQRHLCKIEREGFVGNNTGEGRNSERRLALSRRHPPVVAVGGCADDPARNREFVICAPYRISARLRDGDERAPACRHRPVDCRGDGRAPRALLQDNA